MNLSQAVTETIYRMNESFHGYIYPQKIADSQWYVGPNENIPKDMYTMWLGTRSPRVWQRRPIDETDRPDTTRQGKNYTILILWNACSIVVVPQGEGYHTFVLDCNVIWKAMKLTCMLVLTEAIMGCQGLNSCVFIRKLLWPKNWWCIRVDKTEQAFGDRATGR